MFYKTPLKIKIDPSSWDYSAVKSIRFLFYESKVESQMYEIQLINLSRQLLSVDLNLDLGNI
ncbi:MAG: hypothetical protein HRU38_17425 [Saccharospirillaceae bacterium]|nr:hypothetical protein [Pseudomonadales bacterium]NRB80420.1 hypothetical protein [Saccharospirillaceae bacterium]